MIEELGRRARAAAAKLALAPTETKDAALAAIADALIEHEQAILAANAKDVARATEEDVPKPVVDRLSLDRHRLLDIANAARDVVELTDPVGVVLDEWTVPNGLHMTKVRVPLGVIGMIYEARPNVTVDAAALCIKSGNACILRGSSSAQLTNEALVGVIADALKKTGLPEHAVQLLGSSDRESAKELMRAREWVDVLIPRGGADLIRTVVEESTVPVIETGVGNCHVYVDARADLAKALPVVLNAKTQRTSVCNAAESLLIHRDVADAFLPVVTRALHDAGVEVRGDDAVQKVDAQARAATEDDWRAEFLDMIISVKVVDSLDQAIEHINVYGTNHTDAIMTEDAEAAERFAREVDSACVIVNASTRFADGGEFGFGAEIGISNQKLHARGPMALAELTSYKYIVRGDGQVRG